MKESRKCQRRRDSRPRGRSKCRPVARGSADMQRGPIGPLCISAAKIVWQLTAGDFASVWINGLDGGLIVHACPWRIHKLPHKRIGSGSLVRYRLRATVHIDVSSIHTGHPPVGHRRQTHAPGRNTCSRGRILIAKATVAHQPSRTTTSTKSEFVGSLPLGFCITVRTAKPNSQAGGHPEAQNLVQIPRGA